MDGANLLSPYAACIIKNIKWGFTSSIEIKDGDGKRGMGCITELLDNKPK